MWYICRMNRAELKQKTIELRQNGLLYREICDTLGVDIPRGPMSGWLRGVQLTPAIVAKLKQKHTDSNQEGRKAAVAVNKKWRDKYLQDLLIRNGKYAGILDDLTIAKYALTMLYVGEGAKRMTNGCLRSVLSSLHRRTHH